MINNKKTLFAASIIGNGSIVNYGIGIPGTQGFGVGVYPGSSDELTAAGLMSMSGCYDPTSDNYGNYQHVNGSIMCFVPAFCYRIGQPTAPSYERDGSNALEIGPASLDGTDGWILHRAFIDGGVIKSGFFIDKYINSKSSDGLTAISVKNGNPISLTTSNSFNRSDTITGGIGTQIDAITFGRNRGDQYSCITCFQQSAISMLSLAHAQASTSAEFCAQYDSANITNYPRGNNNTKTDANDDGVTFTASDATTSEASYYVKAGSGVPFAKTTHNGQNCGISDVNGNKHQPCIGYSLFSKGLSYVLKESMKAHDVTDQNVGDVTKYDQVSGHYESGTFFWGADALQTESTGPERAMCGVMPKTQTSIRLKIFGDDNCKFNTDMDYALIVGGLYNMTTSAGIFTRSGDQQSGSYYSLVGCRAAGYLN